ncbi:MAG: CotH kinase family protein, partial [Endozoicomonas sp.]
MGNPASDPDAFATMGLMTDGSNLPLIFINGFGQVISDSKIAARFEIIHNNQLDATNNPASNQLNRIPAQLTSDDFDRSYLTEIATRPDGDAGVSKPGYDFEPKVPTTITITATAGPDNTTLCSSMVFQFYDNGEREIETKISKVEEADEAVLGMPEEDDWVMHGPLADKTLMRNVLAHYLMGQISNRYAPKTRWAEVFLTSTDDGFPGVYNYQGVYVFTEEMEVDSNRINIGKPPKGKRDRNTLGFGYLFEVDNTYASVKSNFTSIGQNSTVYFDYIDPTYYEVEHEFGLGNYARQIIGDFETVLSRLRKDDPLSVLESQMDVDSFVDFFLITELAKNQDGYRRNTFFYKDAANNQGKFTMGPVTSYGRAFGNADSCG